MSKMLKRHLEAFWQAGSRLVTASYKMLEAEPLLGSSPLNLIVRGEINNSNHRALVDLLIRNGLIDAQEYDLAVIEKLNETSDKIDSLKAPADRERPWGSRA